MTTNISTSAGVLFTAHSLPQPHYIWLGFDWYDPEDSAQGQPLTLEELTRYGQPISCSIVDCGWVFISYGHENLCIREQIQAPQQENYVGLLDETDPYRGQGILVGWALPSDQGMSPLVAGYVAGQEEIAEGSDRTIGVDAGLDFYDWLAEAITTTDIGSFLLGTEAPHFLDEPAGALQPEDAGWSLSATANPLLAREFDAAQPASREPLAKVILPTPSVILQNYEQRIDQLKVIGEEEDIFVSTKSCEDFWIFIRNYCSSPQAGLILTDEGNLVAIWREANGSTVEVEFWGAGQCRLIIFKDPAAPLRVLPEISRDTLANIGEKLGAFSFVHICE